jgi:hypothetical protein
MKFEIFISTNGIFLKIQAFPSQYFLIWKGIIFENFNIYENNIMNLELAKVLGYEWQVKC